MDRNIFLTLRLTISPST